MFDRPGLDPQGALLYLMVMAAGSDGEVKESEYQGLERLIQTLPVFRGVDSSKFGEVTQAVAGILDQDDGLTRALEAARDAIPDHLRETAYALACDVVAADGRRSTEEARFLQLLRPKLGVDKLAAAAIERAAQARHMTL